MKSVILAGGLGSRLSEETDAKPKPMVTVGGKPILWHVMKIYAAQGINDFIICLGYKGYMIKEYFANYFLHMSDVTFDMQKNSMTVHQNYVEPWKVTLVNTGEDSMTGGRLKRVLSYVGDEDFCFTYGDGVGDVDIQAAIALHRKEGRIATVTATQQPGRYGALEYKENKVTAFVEKPHGESGWINGGFFVLSPKVVKYLKDDATIWEREPMLNLAKDGELSVYFHHGFWQPMDTLREKYILEDLWRTGKAPWKIWK
jgi:glucose-1-phosphate cytidylyltransferase